MRDPNVRGDGCGNIAESKRFEVAEWAPFNHRQAGQHFWPEFWPNHLRKSVHPRYWLTSHNCHHSLLVINAKRLNMYRLNLDHLRN